MALLTSNTLPKPNIFGLTQKQNPSAGILSSLSQTTPAATQNQLLPKMQVPSYGSSTQTLQLTPQQVASAAPPAPSTAVKSVSSGADGSKTTEYHKPDAQPTAAATFNPNAAQQTAGTQSAPQGTPAPQAPQQAPLTYPGLIGGLAQFNPMNNPQVSQAYQKAQDINTRLEALQENRAASIAGSGRSGAPLGDVVGRQGALNQAALVQQAGLASQLQGQTNLFQAGLTGTQQQLAGQQSAAGLAQPQFPSYQNAQFDPLTGQYKDVGNGRYGSGPAAAANVQSIGELTQQVNSWSASRQSAQNLGGQLSQFLQTNNVNPSDFSAVNRFLQNIGAQTSSPQYKDYHNLVTDLASVYAEILTPPGGSPSDYRTQLAQSLIDSAASGQSIIQILQGLDAQAQNKIQGKQETIQTLQTGGNVNPASSPQNTSAPTGGSLYDW